MTDPDDNTTQPPADLGAPAIDTSQPPVTTEEDEHVAQRAAWTESGAIAVDPFSGIDPGIRAYVDHHIAKLREETERSISALTVHMALK